MDHAVLRRDELFATKSPVIPTAPVCAWRRRPFRAILVGMRSALAFALLAIVSCGKQVNPEYCESALHLDDPICHNSSIFLDASIDAAIACTGNVACMNTADPVCDTSKGICVQCILNTQCSPQDPICDPGTDSCRGCVADNECPGQGARCLPDGRCTDQSEIVYVDSAGQDNGDCSFGNPCNTITKGIVAATTSGKHVISATGQFDENVLFDNVGPLTLACATGTTLTSNGGDNQKPVLEFRGGAIVEVDRLTIIDTSPTDSPVPGVQLTAGGTQKVALYEDAITGAPEPVNNNNGTRPQAPGIEVAAGSLTMARSMVWGFEQVGVQFETGAGPFDLENNFISDNGYQKNGSGGTLYGGVAILDNAGTSTFAWNSVAFNGNSNNGNAAGVYCASGVEIGIGNLFFHDQGGSPSPFSTTCQITTSYTGADPKFKNGATAPYDLHLTPGSGPVIDKAGQGCMNLLDIDDQSRPYGAQCDYGADEYH